MATVGRGDGGGAVRWGVRIENFDVKECVIEAFFLKVFCFNV